MVAPSVQIPRCDEHQEKLDILAGHLAEVKADVARIDGKVESVLRIVTSAFPKAARDSERPSEVAIETKWGKVKGPGVWLAVIALLAGAAVVLRAFFG